ncbi:restriction endonuclease subunit S [Campylobacter jejuni]|nr:restriction endonuclease subunit S [Campylobacter jejuni]EAI4350253.1 restriction endonuclease subunit S [Campylobacter jejuni]EAL8576595.1 restriction endonuclease subunit S [Campylobacter jejuni]ELX2319745.1 restriction endonuclease subunit S [Campylobacter jejuni]
MSKFAKVKLKNCATFINSMAFKPIDWDVKGLPIVRIQNLTGTNKNFNYYSKEYNPKFEINNGDLLISWSASLGIFIWNNDKAILNQHIFKVVFYKIEINKKYFYFCILDVLEEMSEKTHGSVMRHITKGDFDNIEIPLPPLKEQKRIVGILDESFAKIDESIKILEQNLLNLDELMQSALQKAFNPLNDNTKENYQLPQSWEWKSLGDTSNYGKTSQVKPSQLKGNDWILELEDIEKESGVLLQKVLFQDRQSKSNKIKFNKGDILFGTLRPYLKKVIIADDNGACSSEIMPFSTGNSITNHFIYYYLFANFLHDRISSLTYGARMPRLGTKDGKSLQIPLPPLQEQEQIAEHLDFVFEKAKALKELYTKELKDYEELKQSLLDKAFKGEL